MRAGSLVVGIAAGAFDANDCAAECSITMLVMERG